MISAIILTRNEEKNVVDCINSVKWCDEVIVVDDNSTDRTIEIAEREKVEIYKHPLGNNFSAQRNFALEKAKGEWILFVDADERITDSLRYEIQSVISDPMNSYRGFSIKRDDILWGKQLRFGETASIKLLRLGKKNSGEWNGMIHEEWKIKGKIGGLKNSIRHFPHQEISEFLSEINFYTDIRSEELFSKGIKASAFSVIAYPKAKFILNFIIRKGFLDGIEGFIFAIIMSFHSFLVRGKLWFLWQRK